jgi:hypothetical protein
VTLTVALSAILSSWRTAHSYPYYMLRFVADIRVVLVVLMLNIIGYEDILSGMYLLAIGVRLYQYY